MKTTIHILGLPACLALTLVGCDKESDIKTDEAAGSADAATKLGAMANVADEPAAQGDADLTAGMKANLDAGSLDLAATAKLLEKGSVKSAHDLEVALNDPSRKLAHIDVDGDGKIDPVQVVEVDPSVEADVQAGADAEASGKVEAAAPEPAAEGSVEADARVEGQARFEIRAIPTTKLDAEYAIAVGSIDIVPMKAEGKVEISARYAPEVKVEHAVVYEDTIEAKFDGDVVIETRAPFVRWTFAVDRPVFYGVWVEKHRGVKIPPGHLKHGLWKATGDGPPGLREHHHGHHEGRGHDEEFEGFEIHEGRGHHEDFERHEGRGHEDSERHEEHGHAAKGHHEERAHGPSGKGGKPRGHGGGHGKGKKGH